MADNRGGYREGAGRKSKSEKYIGPITAANDAIAAGLPELVRRAFELAHGVEVERDTPDGPKVYSRPPDIKAIAYLMDRLMGKPTQGLEMTGKDGGAIEMDARVRSEATRELDEWRARMAATIPTAPSNTPSASPTAPTSSTPTA